MTLEQDFALIAAAVAALLLPGGAVLLAAGIRNWLELAGLAPLVTVLIAYLAAIATGVLGFDFGLAAFIAATVVLVAALALLATRFPSLRPSERTRPTPGGRLAEVVGGLALLGAVLVGHRTWSVGIGGLSVPPQEHDMITHTAATAYVAYEGVAAPWQVLPADVLSGEPVTFYPAALHAQTALLEPLAGDPVRALNAMTIALCAYALPLGLMALGYRLQPRLVAPLAGGGAALIASYSYRPLVALTHDGGILATAAAFCLVPAAVALVLALGRSAPLAVVTGGALAAVFWVHPTGLISTALVAGPWLGTALLTGTQRVSRALVARAICVGAVAAVLAVPAIASARATVGAVTTWPRDFAIVPFGDAVGLTFGMGYGGFLDPAFEKGQVVIAAAAVLGAIVSLVARRNIGLVVAHLAVSGLLILFLLGSDLSMVKALTGLYYNSYVRLNAPVNLTAWVLAGVALPLATLGAASRITSTSLRRQHSLVAASTVAVTALGLGLVHVLSGRTYQDVNIGAIASRYSTPDFVRVDQHDMAAMNFLADSAKPGERVVNNANDGSTYSYVYQRVPVVNLSPLGNAAAPWTYYLLDHLPDVDSDQEVRSTLRSLNARWVYYDESAPLIGAANDPEDWFAGSVFSVPPGWDLLDETNSLSEVFRSGSVVIYRVSDAVFIEGG